MRRGERPRHRGAEQVGAGVDGAGAQCWEHKVAYELLAQVFDDAIFGAGAFGFRNEAVELAEPLPDVGGEADDARAMRIAQPGNDGGGVESARIGEDDERPSARTGV